VAQNQLVHHQALAVGETDQVGVELVERRADFADAAVFFVFAVIVVVEQGDQAAATVQFPERTPGGLDPETGEFVDDQRAEGPAE